MKKIAVLLSALIIIHSGHAQLKKYPIDNSGCSAYFFCNPGTFNVSYSEDSSILYTGECKAADSITYGIICVKLKEAVTGSQTAEELLISYLDFLKTTFDIRSAAGYGKGHTMDSNPQAHGVIDYWKAGNDDEWKVKGWTDGKFIAVMYVYASGSLQETEKQNAFLNGFRFP